MARMTPPRWRDIADDLIRRIESGDLAQSGGAARRRLPSEKDLENHYGASRNTVRDALSYLQQQGRVVSEQGKGTFVVHRPNIVHVTLSTAGPDVAPATAPSRRHDSDSDEHARTTVSPVRVEVREGARAIAQYLPTDHDSEFICRHQELFLDDQPWALQTSFYPLDFATRGASHLLYPRDIPEGVLAYLGESLGYHEVGYHDEIRARPPDENERRFFNLGESAADTVFETIRTAYSTDGEAFRLTVTVWPTDRTRLHVTSGQISDDIFTAPRVEPPREAPPAEGAGSE